MDQVVNLRLLEPGTIIRLADGATAEVTSNPQGGVWVFVRHLSAPGDSSLEESEEMVFAQDIVQVLKTP